MNPSDSRNGLLRFRYLMRRSRWSPHRHNGSPALGNKSSGTCRPCYPGSRWMPLPFFPAPIRRPSPSDHRVGFSNSFTRLPLGSLAFRPALLLFGNSRPGITPAPLPHATGVYGQFPGRDFNPLDLLLLLRTIEDRGSRIEDRGSRIED